MFRTLVTAVFLLFVGCVDTSSQNQRANESPRNAKVDKRLHLSADDRGQIDRLIARETTQPISFIASGIRAGTVEVTCGYWQKPGVPNAKGNAYTLQKAGARWTIVHKGGWVF